MLFVIARRYPRADLALLLLGLCSILSACNQEPEGRWIDIR